VHKKKVHMKLTLFLTVFLALAFIQTANAITYHLPKNTVIRNGLKVHFGDDWISTSGTPITVTAYFEANWLNYTSNAGTQQIHNGTKPTAVYFDGVNQTEGTTWSYAGGTVTTSPSSTNVAIYWGTITEPEEPDVPATPSYQSFLQFLWAGDYLGFIQAVYVSAFQSADLLYGVILLLFMAPLYIRTRSLLLMSILWILLGSLFLVAMPIVSGLAILLLSFGLAGMFYKLFMRVRG